MIAVEKREVCHSYYQMCRKTPCFSNEECQEDVHSKQQAIKWAGMHKLQMGYYVMYVLIKRINRYSKVDSKGIGKRFGK